MSMSALSMPPWSPAWSPVGLPNSEPMHLLIATTMPEASYVRALAEDMRGRGARVEFIATREALTGGTAKDTAEAHFPGEAFDIVLLDTHPHSAVDEDPYALCQQIVQRGIPVFILALFERDTVIDRALAAGAEDILILPMHPGILTARLRRTVKLRAQMKALKQAEDHWQNSFGQSFVVQLLIEESSGQIIDANAAASLFYGYSVETMRALSLADLQYDDDSQTLPEMQEGCRHKLYTGEIRDVKMFTTVFIYQGRTFVHAIIQDNTKRRLAETNDQTNRALVKALRNTAAALLTTFDRNELFDRILEYVHSVLPSDTANIKLVHNGMIHMVKAVGYGTYANEEENTRETFNLDQMPNLRRIAETKQPLAIPDTLDSAEWLADPRWSWIRSQMTAPLCIDDKVIGFVTLDSEHPRRFSQSDAERLQALSDQAAIAIRNLRLYERVQRQASELERRVQERTAQLRSEREQLSGILDSMNDGVVYTDFTPDGKNRVRYINPAMERMSGYSFHEWRDGSLWMFRFHEQSPDDFRVMMRHLVQTLNNNQPFHNQGVAERKNGTFFDVSTTTTPLRDSTGRLVGAVTVMRDVSKEKALQAQQARFVAHASHELRTPITNLKTRLYLLHHQPAQQELHLRVMEEVTNRMRRLVDDLLDISRFERGAIQLNRAHVALNEVLVRAVSVQVPEADKKQIALTLDIDDVVMIISADAERITQVITNLLTNAINYTHDAGSIRVRAYFSVVMPVSPSLVKRSTDQLPELHESGYAVVEVQDTGIGISEEHLAHIFEPFYRVVSQVYAIRGTGLGLNISREIVELHGGALDVRSEVGKGSVFTFWVPLAAQPVEQVQVQPM